LRLPPAIRPRSARWIDAVGAEPLANRVVRHAITAPDSHVTELLDLREELIGRRTLNLPEIRPGTRLPDTLTTLDRAIALAGEPRPKRRFAKKAVPRPDWVDVLPAVRRKRGSAVRTDDSQVLETVVRCDTVRVVEDERHLAAAPELTLPAQLARPSLEAGLV